ncbi:MAG: BlaI/MecI/CopY family transcriptional regulator [Clostridiales bacterium]|jgi:predicted transcriptional regulator|nr:BlaI/MecI/CopY family transcriptional regulator [Clostridiales bacterium]
MRIKLFDSELKVMDVLWKEGDLTAKRIAGILGELVGWNKNTTYTVIKKCVEKGAIERGEPNFICHALVTKEQAREYELDELIGKLYDGSSDLLFASLLERKNLPAHTLEKLKSMVGDAKETG